MQSGWAPFLRLRASHLPSRPYPDRHHPFKVVWEVPNYDPNSDMHHLSYDALHQRFMLNLMGELTEENITTNQLDPTCSRHGGEDHPVLLLTSSSPSAQRLASPRPPAGDLGGELLLRPATAACASEEVCVTICPPGHDP